MRGKVARFPSDLLGADAERFKPIIRESIVGSLAPAAPLIAPGAKIWSVGSCFAVEIAKVLNQRGCTAYESMMQDQWVSAFVLKSIFEWVVDDKEFTNESLKSQFELPGGNGPLKRAMAEVDVMVITLGVSLCWFDAQGQVGIFGIKKPVGMRQTSVAENEQAILETIALIRKVRPELPIVLTLSPVPMNATLTGMPVIPSSTVSKSTLRVALEAIRQRRLDHVYYWPSYEIVNTFAGHIAPAYGADDDPRHVHHNVIEMVVDAFLEYYVHGAAPTSSP